MIVSVLSWSPKISPSTASVQTISSNKREWKRINHYTTEFLMWTLNCMKGRHKHQSVSVTVDIKADLTKAFAGRRGSIIYSQQYFNLANLKRNKRHRRNCNSEMFFSKCFPGLLCFNHPCWRLYLTSKPALALLVWSSKPFPITHFPWLLNHHRGIKKAE